MKTFSFTTIIAAFLFICNSGIPAQTVKTDSPSKVEYYKVSEVRIFINNQSDIMELRKQGLSFENMKLNDKSFEVMLDSYHLNILKNISYKYEILIDDVTKDYLERTKESRAMLKLKKATKTSGFGLGSMGGFYTLSEVVAQIDSMRSKYPNLITAKDSIGTSVEGRTIWAVKISDNPNVKENEPEIFYNSLTHAREPQGMMCVLYFMFHLLENYGTDPEVTYLVNNRELYFIPVINPDGFVYNEQISPDGGGMWRKNRRGNDVEIFGVDLNRNYGYMWGIDDIGSNPNPQLEEYRGTGPFSEPENQAIRKFCNTHNFIIGVNYHSYWDVVFPPWGYNLKQTPDSTTFNSFIKLATAINGYRNGNYILPHERYPSNGDVCDWMYSETSEKNRIFAVLTEVGSESDGFWPEPGRIIPLAEENLYSNLVYAWGPGIIENPPYVSDGKINTTYLNPMTDTLKFNAVEQNPDNQASKVYAQILNSKDSIVSETLLNQTDSAFCGTLSLNSFGEDFYKVRYKQSGTNIPSNSYFTDYNKIRFTTVPLLIDDLNKKVVSASKFTFQPILKNAATSKDITNLKINLISNDPWIKSITPAEITVSYVKAGRTRNTPSFTVSIDTITFPGKFNFTFSISSEDCPYWIIDTTIAIIPTGIEQIASHQFETGLEQNYPNPFNAVTTINWQVAENSKVTLKVLDIVGRTVATLVNEQRPQGKYETQFNAATLPKGIYFCQLKAGENIQTRKMILLE